ncbi:MAG TPA: toll/interleukin-1 receptor domain-containing protein, partial [Cellvibrionaceae bacterium]|nr:toll/interleukin-1 receptor domain-containing protein [Cellvibrionaceae bacterium]
KKSGSYGVDNAIFDSMIKNNTLKELTSEFEFHRRLLGGAAWEGNTWILDLLPNHPIRAVQALEAYQTAHIGLYTDHMLYGSYDAIELVRTRYNLPREAPMSSLMQSTFLSYGGPDEGFARKLYEALQRSGVPTFFFPEHAEPGEKLHRLMRNKVNEQDRIILVCSKNSLDRKGVLNEIEEVLIREANDGGASYLIPIRLDGYIFDGWHPPNADVALAVRAKVVANFEGTEGDHSKFEAALQRLLKALEKKVFPAT